VLLAPVNPLTMKALYVTKSRHRASPTDHRVIRSTETRPTKGTTAYLNDPFFILSNPFVAHLSATANRRYAQRSLQTGVAAGCRYRVFIRPTAITQYHPYHATIPTTASLSRTRSRVVGSFAD
jgi:hypothetical protein